MPNINHVYCRGESMNGTANGSANGADAFSDTEPEDEEEDQPSAVISPKVSTLHYSWPGLR